MDHDGAEDWESPYFDWANDRLFSPELRGVIDQIAHDPRFSWGYEGEEIAREWAGHLPEDRFQAVKGCAWCLFDETVGKDLDRKAKPLVNAALADPDFEFLPAFGDAESPDIDYFRPRIDGQDPRLLDAIRMYISQSPKFQELAERARRDTETEAGQLVDALDVRTRDRLVLATRVAEREQLLGDHLTGMSPLRRSWTAYFAHNDAKERFGASTADRYSAAARTLMGRGWTKKAASSAMQISTSRLNTYLSSGTAIDLADDDPLCELIPGLRGAGGEWAAFSPTRAGKKSFSSLPVTERAKLAASTEDPEVLDKLASDKSPTVIEALFNRQRDRGNLSGGVLGRALSQTLSEWALHAAWNAHQANTFPGEGAIQLARHFPAVLLTCDGKAAEALESEAPLRFSAALALRRGDADALSTILAMDTADHSWKQLRDLLVGFPLPKVLADNGAFAQSLIDAASRLDGSDEAVVLRLVACQNDGVRNRHVAANVRTGEAFMSPQDLVSQALGSYHESSRVPRSGVLAGARALWSASDLTVEHGLARSIVAESGTASCVIETKLTTYEATPDAIYAFAKTDERSYTYVHLHLTIARHHHLPGVVVSGPTSLPALGYHRSGRPHPDYPTGPNLSVIAWPLPLSPAIYSLGVGLGSTAGYFAVADGLCSVVEGLPDNTGAAVTIKPANQPPVSRYPTVRDAVRAARQTQIDAGGDYGVGVAVPAADGTEERFVQWSDVVQSAGGWTIQRIEASVEDPAIQGQLGARGFRPDESLSQYNLWVDVSQQQSWASEDEMLAHLCGLLELLGAADGVALIAYP